jgi:uncharacterized integral membrane protein (TIGR00698 family)
MASTLKRRAASNPAIARAIPGVTLCIGVALLASVIERVEARLAGRAWLEALVLAILIGTALRGSWTPGRIWTDGIRFSAKMLLEIAGIAGVVLLAISLSYGIGRLLGLPRRMAALVACGNSICGNSAIAAVAPVIGANGRDIAAAIAFTAVLGVAVVLLLPLTVPLLHLTTLQYGTLAGLTVYAVPQVLAATAPIGPLAVQIGTLVKLMRVLMLGPVVLLLALLARRAAAPSAARPLGPHRMVPWFIIGFLALAAARAAGVLPVVTLAPIAFAANLLTVIAMAALGLSTDLRVVARAGLRASAAVTLSLIVLGGISLALIRVLGLA